MHGIATLVEWNIYIWWKMNEFEEFSRIKVKYDTNSIELIKLQSEIFVNAQ